MALTCEDWCIRIDALEYIEKDTILEQISRQDPCELVRLEAAYELQSKKEQPLDTIKTK